MDKPRKKEYGFSRLYGWLQGDEAAYNTSLEAWNNRPRAFGKPRVRPVHPSWEPYMEYFDPSTPRTSQNGFSLWVSEKYAVAMSSAYISAQKHKPITQDMRDMLERWKNER
jgi:hypothetical protein